ncbi:MAG: sigma-54 dependent transcriptional regulator [Nitrospirota bacterium]
MDRILIVDDDASVRAGLGELLEAHGLPSFRAGDGLKALEIARSELPAAVLLDLKMPGMDGSQTMKELKKIDPELPVIILTGHGDVPTAVELIKRGAHDFFLKPPAVDHLAVVLRRAIEKRKLDREVRDAAGSSFDWLGKSPAMQGIIRQILQVAPSNFSVIIQGETGTGKSVIARTIHSVSGRSERPFVAVDIGAIPETLVESELFGHEKGAFTGAERKKRGYFETAHGGTIFIDELENMSGLVQGKLLTAVEARRIFPLGTATPVDVDVRIIAATNSELKRAVVEKKFREDLFYRIGEFIITLPPLRERREDIPFLAQQLLSEAAGALGKEVKTIAEDALELLIGYSWPGNVRELKGLMKRAALLAAGGTVRPEHLQFLAFERSDAGEAAPLFPLRTAVKGIEMKAVRQALTISAGNKSKAAALLEIDYKTLLSKVKEYGL